MTYQGTTMTPADTAEAYAAGRAGFKCGEPRPTGEATNRLISMQQGWDDAAIYAAQFSALPEHLPPLLKQLESFVTDAQRIASALLKYHKATPGDKRNASGVMVDADAITETIQKIREKL